MKHRALVVLALLTAALFAWWMLSDKHAPSTDGGSTLVEHEDSHRNLTAHKARSRETIADAERQKNVDPDASVERAYVVRGRIRHGRTAFAHARLEGLLFYGHEATGEPLARKSIEADEHGAFAWKLSAPTRLMCISFRSTDEQVYVNEKWSLTLLPPAAPAPTDVEVQAMPLDITITGVVLGSEDRPIQGARVRTRFRHSAETDHEGRFELRHSSYVHEIGLVAGARGYATKHQSVKVPKAGARVATEICLEAGLRISGRVVDELDNPIAGANLSTSWFTLEPIESAADGSFVFDGLLRDQNVGIYARKAGYLNAYALVDPRKTKSSYVIVLTRGLRVAGRVLGPKRRPIEGARLQIDERSFPDDTLYAVSGPNGGFAFPVVRSGLHTLTTLYPALTTDTRKIEVPKDRPLVDIEILLSRALSVSGVVVDEGGAPIERAWVNAVSARIGQETRPIRARSVRSDKSGRFHLGQIPPGEIKLSASATGYLASFQTAKGGSTKLRFVLRRSGYFAGRVIDAETKSALQDFRIRLRNVGASIEWTDDGARFRNTDGYWKTPRYHKPGRGCVVEASAPGYATSWGETKAQVSPDRDAFVLQLERGGTIRGVVLAGGRALEEAIVRVYVRLSSDESSRRGHRLHTRARTQPDGSFAVHDIPAGRATLRIRHRQHPVAADGPFDVVRGSSVQRRITMPETATLVGTVRDANGKSLAGAQVTLIAIDRRGDDDAYHYGKADSTGRFVFDKGLAAGRYRINARRLSTGHEGLSICRIVRVEAGAKKEIDLTPPGKLSCTARVVVDPVSRAVTRVRITKLDSTGKRDPWFPPISVEAKAETASFHGLTPGTYHVEAEQQLLGQSIAKARAKVELRDSPRELVLRCSK